MSQYSSEEIKIAIKIKNHIDKIGGVGNFNATKIDGIVIEKPHLNRFKNILEYINHESF